MDKYELVITPHDEAPLFYSAKPERDQEIGCIGHMRMDFGRNGNEFWHTWTDHCSELNTQSFKDDFKELINTLREGFLRNLSSMSSYCYNNSQGKLNNGRDGNYGYKIKTNDYIYYLRCSTLRGDYNLYCYSYQRDRLEKAFASVEKPSLMDKVEKGKQKAAHQEQPDKTKNKRTEVLE